METPPSVTRGLIGAAIGLSVGLFVTMVLYWRHDVRETANPVSKSPSGLSVRKSAEGVDGATRTLGSATTGASSEVLQLGPKTEAVIILGVARSQTGMFDKAVEVTRALAEGPERDRAIELIAERIVPSEAQFNLGLIDGGGGVTSRQGILARLREVLRLSALAQGGLTKSRLFIRAALVKRALDEQRPGASNPAEADLSFDNLLSQADAIVRGMPDEHPNGKRPFEWAWGLIISGFLAAFGFVAANVAKPVVDAASTVVAAFAARRIGINALAAQLHKKEQSLLDGKDLPPP
ncbi:MAG: hypothetical protein P4L85_09070 [Paludisphaera borealis]|uniref:hypothetical protein n=1 Tax=Paludisphaera borealis TaxID=1387353 RepID=UPI002846799C|nr:hypothetical protein [Paludisphaera borealis]MDR3619489.1 hypothetical protein [Paludisphaera borealis]